MKIKGLKSTGGKSETERLDAEVIETKALSGILLLFYISNFF